MATENPLTTVPRRRFILMAAGAVGATVVGGTPLAAQQSVPIDRGPARAVPVAGDFLAAAVWGGRVFTLRGDHGTYFVRDESQNTDIPVRTGAEVTLRTLGQVGGKLVAGGHSRVLDGSVTFEAGDDYMELIRRGAGNEATHMLAQPGVPEVVGYEHEYYRMVPTLAQLDPGSGRAEIETWDEFGESGSIASVRTDQRAVLEIFGDADQLDAVYEYRTGRLGRLREGRFDASIPTTHSSLQLETFGASRWLLGVAALGQTRIYDGDSGKLVMQIDGASSIAAMSVVGGKAEVVVAEYVADGRPPALSKRIEGSIEVVPLPEGKPVLHQIDEELSLAASPRVLDEKGN